MYLLDILYPEIDQSSYVFPYFELDFKPTQAIRKALDRRVFLSLIDHDQRIATGHFAQAS